MNSKNQIKVLNEIQLIGITQIGEFEKAPQMFERLMKWSFEKGLLNGPEIKTATVYHDNPRVTEISKVRWSACLLVDSKIDTEEDLRNIIIHKGKYAVGHFEIDRFSFEKAWQNLIEWVKNNGFDFGIQDYFEIYHGDHRMHPENKFVVDICIPLK